MVYFFLCVQSGFLGKPYSWVMAFIHCENLCIFLRLFKLFVFKSVIKMFKLKSAILQLPFIPLFLFPSLLLDWQFWWLYFISIISFLAIDFLLFTCCPTFYNIHSIWICSPGMWRGITGAIIGLTIYFSLLSGISLVLPVVRCQEMIVHCALSGFLVVYGINTIPVWVHPSWVELRSPLTNF